MNTRCAQNLKIPLYQTPPPTKTNPCFPIQQNYYYLMIYIPELLLFLSNDNNS